MSRHLRHHSIGKFMRGLFKLLPREHIELYSLFPGQVSPAIGT